MSNLANRLREIAAAPTQHPTWAVKEALTEAASVVDEVEAMVVTRHADHDGWPAFADAIDTHLTELAERIKVTP